MPKSLILRHLPGQGGKLLDEAQLPPGHVVFNPSIAWPYIYMRGNKQNLIDEDNYIILHNIQTQQSTTINNLENILQKNMNRYRGLEDLRIVHYKNKLWFTATSTHASPSMNSELVVGYFNDQKTRIERISHVPLGKPPIKNVCPFVYDDKLCIFDIYKKELHEIGDIFTSTDILPKPTLPGAVGWKSFIAMNCRKITTGSGLDIENFRGSTSPVHLHGSTYGCIVHDVIFNESSDQRTQLAYLNHWIEIDMNLAQVTFISSPFWVFTFGIEFISGMYIVGDNVELYAGVQDKSALKYITTLSFLRHGK
jgi:hypothetical protein